MEIGVKNQFALVAFLVLYGLLANQLWAEIERSQTGNLRIDADDEIHVGVVLDMESIEGKIISSCISIAMSDFYGQHKFFSTRIVLHEMNSRGEPLQALSTALALLEKTKVAAIIGGQTRMEAKFLAELGDKAEIPFISVSEPISYSPFNEDSFVLQITEDEVSQFIGMAATVKAFNWRDIILIYEETEIGRDIIYLIDCLQEKNINVKHKFAIAASFTEKRILDELHRFSTLQTTIFVVHILRGGLLSQLLINAKKVGIMTKGYAWLLSATATNLLRHVDLSVIESMQGIIGLKFHIPASRGLHNLTSRLRRKFYIENPNIEVMELGTSAIRAYDSAWAIAKAAESFRVKIVPSSKPIDNTTLHDLFRFKKLRSSNDSCLFLKKILQSKFVGLSGQFQFVNGKLLSPCQFEMVNFIGKGERRVGYLTDQKKENMLSEPNKGRCLLSPNGLEAIIWPGGSTTIPEGRSMMQRKFRIGVPVKRAFKELVRVDHDNQSNSTNVSGFCIDVFKAAVNLLPYKIDYEFVPFHGRTYSDLIFQVYLKNYDAVVGDVTITSNRSLYVDFTQPFSELGFGMLVKGESKNMWIFLKPLSTNLWMTTGGFFLLIGFIVWVIESPTNREFQGTKSEQLGTALSFAFSTLAFAQREKLLNNLSKLVVIVWFFVVLILTSSYTATLASMMTIRQIRLHGGENNIGYKVHSFIGNQDQIRNLNFKELKPLVSVEEFAEALSKGSKHGGVSSIIDEIPYIKIFLATYGTDQYSMVKSLATTNGFGFAFPKGSTLVQDMSNAIMTLRETGALANLEKTWFDNDFSLISDQDSSKDPNALDLENFQGLFIISGATSSLALFLFLVFYFRENLDPVRKYIFNISRHLWVSCVTKYHSNEVQNTINDDENRT